jgi:hypothetical protein
VGKANRHRRAAKKRESQRRTNHGPSGGQGGRLGDTAATDVRYLFFTAAAAVAHRSAEGNVGAIWAALRSAAAKRGTSATGLAVDDVFRDCLRSVFEGGWQPAEVVRAVRRGPGNRHADLAATAVAASHTALSRTPPGPWVAQLRQLEAAEPWWGRGRDWLSQWSLRSGIAWGEALSTAVETLAVLLYLPKTEVLLTPPSQWTSVHAGIGAVASVDEAVLEKVRALLAKAESTSFEQEAASLTAKAQELMARHSIDDAFARHHARGHREMPIARRVPVDEPYAGPKSSLLAAVAVANSARCVWDDRFALMTVIGFEADLDAIEVLFTSLLVQASKAMLAKGQVRDVRGRSRTRSFRQSFYVAFAQRVNERLQMAAGEARRGAERDFGRDLLPVLAGRRQQIDDLTAQMFPRLTTARRAAVTNAEGWRAGLAAAEMATLGPTMQRLDGATG